MRQDFDDPREFIDDFADKVTITVEGRAPFDVLGIFDEKYLNAKAGEFDMAAARPRLSCVAADIAGLKKYTRAVIGGKPYYFDHDPHPDGNGLAVVFLALDTDEL